MSATLPFPKPSPFAIQNILASVFGSVPEFDSIQFIPHGIVTYTFAALAPPGPVIVKVRRIEQDSFASFSAHSWAMQQWRSADVPTPQVFSFTSDYCVEQRMPGSHQSESSLSPREQDAFLAHMAETFERLHSVPCTYYGAVKDGHHGPSHWVSFLFRTFEYSFHALRRSSLFSSTGIDQLEKLVTTALPSLTPTQPSLLHGDLNRENYLVNNSQITGVIDASECLGGDPNYDLAYFINAHPSLQGRVSTLFSHYRACDTDRVRVYRAAIGVKKLVCMGLKRNDFLRIAREKANLLTLL